MQITWTKILALLVGIAYAVIVVMRVVPVSHSIHEDIISCVSIMVPVALIWFPDLIGMALGSVGRASFTVETPSVMVAFMGWVVLIGMPAAAYFLLR
ncbi:MAG: hypothetical protein WCI73_00660 [Phycisphaerae bacterium]